MPTIAVRYTKEHGDWKGVIKILTGIKGARYDGNKEAEAARKLFENALEQELLDGVAAALPLYLSKKQGSQYEGKKPDVIKRMIIKNGLDLDIQDWLVEVNG